MAVKGDRIAYVGKPRTLRAKRTIDAHGLAVAPGFINMLSQAQESIFADGREESDLFQGVTLEVTGEGDSMGPLTDQMALRGAAAQSDIKYNIDWRTLGQYLEGRERGNVTQPGFVCGASTAREYVLGENDVQPSSEQLRTMQALVKGAMEEGALGRFVCAHLCAGHLCQDRRVGRAGEGSGTMRRNLHHPHAQRGRPPASKQSTKPSQLHAPAAPPRKSIT